MMASRSIPSIIAAVVWSLLTLLLLLHVASAQSSPTPRPTTAGSLTPSLSLTTASTTITTDIRNGSTTIPVSTVVPIVFNVTITPTPTASPTPPDPRHLDTQLDPAFGVLGAILILTGIPSAFLGHKNRWTSFFLIGFYTLSLVCVSLILRFGVLEAVNPPTKSLRGLFVLACVVAGVAGGAVSIFFWKATKYFIGAWGGLAFGFWIQCFSDGGLIHPIGFRWIMYIVCAVIGFILCTVPQLHYYIIIVSTAFVGATSFMLGVDCFTAANVKEFYLWNLGFMSLFERYQEQHIEFPVTQTMEIELGLLGAVAIMGIALQLRILKILHRKLSEIKAEQMRIDKEQDARAAERFASMEAEKAEWEREHPALLKHGRNDSTFPSSPFFKDTETAVGSPASEKHGSTFSLVGGPRQRIQSGVSTLMALTPGDDARQSPGALPTLDLGLDLENDVPKNYMSPTETKVEGRPRNSSGALSIMQEIEDLKKKEELLSEIQNIRKSLEVLKAETPAPSSSADSRHPSFSSRRTLSHDLGSYPTAGSSHLRPPLASNSRSRAHSLDLLNIRESIGNAIGRPISAPLQQEDEWQAYVRERKLLQPPSGVSPPIATTSRAPLSPTPRLAISPAVSEALLLRQRRESSLSPVMADISFSSQKQSTPKERSSSDIPIALRPQHKKSDSQESYAPGIILPPRNRLSPSPKPKPDASRTVSMSFEELEGRHREKLRQLQQPITKAEKEHADVEAARSRWQRAKELEKQAVLKRQAEQAAIASKQDKHKHKHKAGEVPRNSVSLNDDPQEQRHRRSSSADILGAGTRRSSSRRLSTLKVEDWQKGQLEDVPIDPRSRRESSSRRLSGVPFPDSGLPHGRSSRDSRRLSGLPRDPPS